MEGDVGRLVGDRERRRLLEGHGLGDGKDAGFRHGDLVGVSAAWEWGRRDDASARPHARAFARLAYRTRDLTPRREWEVGPLLVLAPAQQDVEEVERRRLYPDHDLVGLRYRLLHLREPQCLLRFSQYVYLPGLHTLSSSRSTLAAPRLPQRPSGQDGKLRRKTGWPRQKTGGIACSGSGTP